MRALVPEVQGRPGAGMLDVAGRPLLVRQLQWLRDIGIEDVVFEVCEGPQSIERASFLLGPDPLTSRVVVIPSAKPLGVAELARRAGFSDDEPFLLLPADHVAHATLDLTRNHACYELEAPLAAFRGNVRIEIRSLADQQQAIPEACEGWGIQVTSEAVAHDLACAALEGRAQGLLLHAAETRPGIWFARGARVAPDAQLTPPVLLGPEARVYSRAQVGPRVVIGRAAVIERESVIADAAVAPETVVGEGTRIRQALAHAHGMISFADGSATRVEDSLVLAARSAPRTAFKSRLFASALLLLLCIPWLIWAGCSRLFGKKALRALSAQRGTLHVGQLGIPFIDLVPALADVVFGMRDLVGVNDEKALEIACSRGLESLRPGALDVSRALAPNASTSTLLRMWRWYRAHKNPELDRALWRSRPSEAPKKAA